MKLVIDDFKDYGGDIIVRTPEAGKKVLKAMSGIITTLYIDFDLGHSENGADVVLWALMYNCLPKVVQVVSLSPPGRERIEGILRGAGYERNIDGYYKEKNEKA